MNLLSKIAMHPVIQSDKPFGYFINSSKYLKVVAQIQKQIATAVVYLASWDNWFV